MPVLILFVPAHLSTAVISEALPPLLLSIIVVLIGIVLHVTLSTPCIVLLLAVVIIVRTLLAVPPSLIRLLSIHVALLIALVTG
jgi:hypothetical protein